ncbi:MAG: PKD domain-containing protein [Actinomycetota bacterium]
MTIHRPLRALLVTTLAALSVAVISSPAAAQDGEGADPRPDERLVQPPEFVRVASPGATHLLHLTLDTLLADEDWDFFAFDPGPDETCDISGEVWIEMSARDGVMSPYRIEPPRPGTVHSLRPLRGYVHDGFGSSVLFSCAGEVSVCWWDSTVQVRSDGSAVLHVDVRLFEGGRGWFGPYRPCKPGDQVDQSTITIVAPPDRNLHCNRNPVDRSTDFYGPWTVADGGGNGAAVQACLGVHPIDELISFDAWLPSGTTGATGSLAVTAAAHAVAYGGLQEYRWDFGDGTRMTTSGTNGPSTASHTYTTPGEYWIEVTAIPNRAQPASTHAARIVVLAQPGAPTAVIDAPDETGVGDPVLFDASASGPGTGVSGDIAEYRWDFGDGTQVTLNAFQDQTWEHVYEEEGTYTVTLTAMAMNVLEHTTTHVIEVE